MLKILFIIIFSFFCLYSSAQNMQESFVKAEHLRREARYAEAINLYSRVAFFSRDSLRFKSLLGSGQSYFMLHDYLASLNAYSNALILAGKKDHDDITVHILQCQLYLDDYAAAEGSLNNLDTASQTALQRVIFYKGILAFRQEDFKRSKQEFLRLAGNDKRKRLRIDSLFRRNRKIEHIHPNLALGMSAVLPGSGQVYAGDARDGINSLLLTGFFFFLGYNTAVYYNVLTAIGGVSPWYLRYYTGGLLGAKEIAIREKEYRRAQVFQGLINTFSAGG